jgi:hypothetical protein
MPALMAIADLYELCDSDRWSADSSVPALRPNDPVVADMLGTNFWVPVKVGGLVTGSSTGAGAGAGFAAGSAGVEALCVMAGAGAGSIGSSSSYGIVAECRKSLAVRLIELVIGGALR